MRRGAGTVRARVAMRAARGGAGARARACRPRRRHAPALFIRQRRATTSTSTRVVGSRLRRVHGAVAPGRPGWGARDCDRARREGGSARVQRRFPARERVLRKYFASPVGRGGRRGIFAANPGLAHGPMHSDIQLAVGRRQTARAAPSAGRNAPGPDTGLQFTSVRAVCGIESAAAPPPVRRLTIKLGCHGRPGLPATSGAPAARPWTPAARCGRQLAGAQPHHSSCPTRSPLAPHESPNGGGLVSPRAGTTRSGRESRGRTGCARRAPAAINCYRPATSTTGRRSEPSARCPRGCETWMYILRASQRSRAPPAAPFFYARQ